MAKKEGKESKQEVQMAGPARALNPFEEMGRYFESHFPSSWMRPFQWPRASWGELYAPFEGKIPNVDVIDRENEVVVKAELPGVDKKDIDVSVTKNSVTIKGKTSREEKEEKGNYYRCEISRGAYSRTLPLPAEVNEDKAKANIKDGILELSLPKMEKAKSKKINVE